jgi:hypothetical protein
MRSCIFSNEEHDMSTPKIRYARLLEVRDHVETARDWLYGAPIEELKAVEQAVEQNAPLAEIDKVHDLLVELLADASKDFHKGT